MDLFRTRIKRELTPNLRDPLSLPYRGGEILCFFLDNFTNQTELIKDTILKNEKLGHRPSMPFHVVYELTDTEVSLDITEVLVDSIMRMSKNFGKLAFVGVSRQGRKTIEKSLAQHHSAISFAVSFFDGHEPAKEWLIPGKTGK